MGPRTITSPLLIEGGSRPHRVQVLQGECVFDTKGDKKKGKERITLKDGDEAVAVDYHMNLTPIGRAVVVVTPL